MIQEKENNNLNKITYFINQNINEDKDNENIDNLIYDFDVFDGKLNILIGEKYFIGKGSYGKVYYVGNIEGKKCVIKIAKSDENFNEFEQDVYFYKKYYSTKSSNLINNDDRSLPFLLDFGKAKNKLDNNYYDYMILEYVGINNLYYVLKTKVVDKEEKIIFKMIFNCLYNHLLSFHKSNLVYRDVSPANIVLSDEVISLLINKNLRYREKINENLIGLIPKNEQINNIMENYIHQSYGKIVKFVDGGMFGDLDFVYKNDIYDKSNYLFFGDFIEFNMIDGMFSSTLQYISPFCLFNLSSIVNNCKKGQVGENIKLLIINTLKLADIWSLCIGYIIHLHDTNNTNLLYQVKVNSKSKKVPKTYSKYGLNGTTENTLNSMPFYVLYDNNILLVKELAEILDTNTKLFNEEYNSLRECISTIINEILVFANIILHYSTKKVVKYVLHFDENIIDILYQESIKKLILIHNAMIKYDTLLCKEIIEYEKK